MLDVGKPKQSGWRELADLAMLERSAGWGALIAQIGPKDSQPLAPQGPAAAPGKKAAEPAN